MKTSKELFKVMAKYEEDDPVRWHAYDETLAMECFGERLLSEIRMLVSQLQGAIKRVEKDQHVNSSGEIQSRGRMVDQLCALRENAIQVATRAQRAAAGHGPGTGPRNKSLL